MIKSAWKICKHDASERLVKNLLMIFNGCSASCHGMETINYILALCTVANVFLRTVVHYNVYRLNCFSNLTVRRFSNKFIPTKKSNACGTIWKWFVEILATSFQENGHWRGRAWFFLSIWRAARQLRNLLLHNGSIRVVEGQNEILGVLLPFCRAVPACRYML